MLEVSDGKTFFVENNMEVSIKKVGDWICGGRACFYGLVTDFNVM